MEKNEVVVIGHFDAHGVATSAALARRLGGRVIARFPDTGPRSLPNFIGSIELDGKFVYIVDIPVDVVNPDVFINALAEAARKAESLVYMDHHATDRQFLLRLVEAGVAVKFYATATAMAIDVAGDDPENLKLALVGAVADRDLDVLRVADRRTVEKYLMPLANTLDVLVRRNAQEAADMLVERGVAYLEEARGQVEYPPERLADRLVVEKRSARVALLGFVDGASDRTMSMWLPKTAEHFMKVNGLEYVVIPASHTDPRTKQTVYTVRVVQYWLSEGPTAEEIVRDLPATKGRKIVGHEKYVSILAESREDAVSLASNVYKAIEAHVFSARRVEEFETV